MKNVCYCAGEQMCTPCLREKRMREYVKSHPNATMDDFEERPPNDWYIKTLYTVSALAWIATIYILVNWIV